MAALTPQQLANLGGCFDCLEPGAQQTMLLTLLQQIQAALPGASLTTTSPGGLQTATAVSAANSSRKRFVIQNQKNEVLKLKFGTGCTVADYHVELQEHNSGVKHSQPFIFDGYVGAISVAPAAGNPSYTFSEFV